MKNEQIVTYEKRDKIAIITLNRGNKLNAFNKEMVHSLHQTWKRFEKDDDVNVAVITGEGRAFSAGLDLNDFTPVTSTIPRIGVDISKPIISAINGYCVGIGLVIALMSDIRICSEDAKLIYPEAKIGYTGGVGSLLSQYMPTGVAMEMLLTGDGISAQRGYEVGLVNHVVTKDNLLDYSLEMAEKIANNAPLVVKALRKLAYEPNVMEMGGVGHRLIGEIETSEDRIEGFAAFREKRPPNFIGK